MDEQWILQVQGGDVVSSTTLSLSRSLDPVFRCGHRFAIDFRDQFSQAMSDDEFDTGIRLRCSGRENKGEETQRRRKRERKDYESILKGANQDNLYAERDP